MQPPVALLDLLGRGREPLWFLGVLEQRATVEADAVVLSDDHVQVTAGELVARVRGVADALLDDGDRAPVPVVVERSAASVVGLLGVLWAGRTVVPIEASDASDRTASVLDAVGATAVVQAAHGGPPLDGRRIVDARRGTVGSAPLQPYDPDTPAAVVFTSGSSGRPKGVVYDAALYDATPLRRHNTGWPDDDRWTSIGPLGFTVGILCYPAVASWHLPTVGSPLEYLELLDEGAYRITNITPSAVRAAAAGWRAGRTLPHLQDVGTYGEGLTYEAIADMWRLLGEHVRIHVQYGATETPLGTAVFVVESGSTLGTGPVPLGRPGVGMDVTVAPVDPADPDGPSQLVAHGLTASRYWDDPNLTAARFGADADGRRWWNSGDIAEQGADGLWRHAGRVDDLVKIRGRLVSPLEPEHVLAGAGGVRRAVVLAQPLGTGVRLVGHVEPDDAALDPTALRRTLTGALPRHLVPGVLVRHDELPLTDRYKVDRAALAERPLVPWRSGGYRPPFTDVQWAVAAAVARVLGLSPDDIGRDDDLFDLGLDSLGVVELLADLDEQGVGGLHPDDLLAAPTVAALAARAEGPHGSSAAVVLNPDGSKAPLYVVPGAGSTALALGPLARALGPDRPVVVLEPPGTHDDRRPARSVRDAAASQLRELRRLQATRFAEHRQEVVALAGHSFGGLVAHEMSRLLSDGGTDVRLALLDTHARPTGHGRRLRRLAGDLRRSGGRRPADLAGLGSPAFDDAGRLAQAEALRWGRPLVDVLRGRPFAERSTSGGPTERYLRLFADGVAQTIEHRLRRAEVDAVLLRTTGGAPPEAWLPYVRSLEVRHVPGSHNGMLQPPHVAELCAVLEEDVLRPDPTARR